MGSFLFVNKTASSKSFSRSFADEKYSISVHVQRGRKHTRKTSLKGEALRSKKFRFRYVGVGQAASAQVQTPPTDENDSASDYSETPESSPSPSSEAAPDRKYLTAATCSRQLTILHKGNGQRQHPLLANYCKGNAMDPFHATCINMDPEVHKLLLFYRLVHHPNTWLRESSARPDGHYTYRTKADKVVRGCLSNEMSMYSVLASMAAYMRLLGHDAPLRRELGFYVHKALVATQRYIEKKAAINERFIFDIFHLVCVEWYQLNLESAMMHFRTLKVLIGQFGGLKNLDPSFAEQILLGDIYLAANRLSKPILMFDRDPGRSTDVTMLLEKRIGNNFCAGTALLTTKCRAIVPDELREIVSGLAEVAGVLLVLDKNDKEDQKIDSATLHWFYLRDLALRHRLLKLEAIDPRTDALGVALIIWGFTVMTVSARKRMTPQLAEKLRGLLGGIDQQEWYEHEAVLCWILTIGAMAATSESSTQAWFLLEIRCLLFTFKIFDGDQPPDSVEDAEKIWKAFSEKFFYLDFVQASLLHHLVMKIA